MRYKISSFYGDIRDEIGTGKKNWPKTLIFSGDLIFFQHVVFWDYHVPIGLKKNQHKILDFFTPALTYYKKKICSYVYSEHLEFFTICNNIQNLQYKGWKAISIFGLRIIRTGTICSFYNHSTLHCRWQYNAYVWPSVRAAKIIVGNVDQGECDYLYNR